MAQPCELNCGMFINNVTCINYKCGGWYQCAWCTNTSVCLQANPYCPDGKLIQCNGEILSLTYCDVYTTPNLTPLWILLGTCGLFFLIVCVLAVCIAIYKDRKYEPIAETEPKSLSV